MQVIARVRNDFPSKFGIPRQSLLVPSVISKIVFEPQFRNRDALRGIEGFSYLWLIWEFSENLQQEAGWSPTVRPPRLGGNERMGVFATRSPFRPNPIGLSCVKLEKVELDTPDGPVIVVSGADLMDGTPIYDIKPYLPGVDAHPDAASGFVGENAQTFLEVELPQEQMQSLTKVLSSVQIEALKDILAQDPRPAYHNDPDRVYGLPYSGLDIRFRVENGVCHVVEIKF